MSNIIIIGIVALALIVGDFVGDNMRKNAEDIVKNASQKYAIYISGSFDEMSSVLESSSKILSDLLSVASLQNPTTASVFESSAKSSLDAGAFARYGFVYLLDAPHFAAKNRAYTTPKGNVVMIFQDKILIIRVESKSCKPPMQCLISLWCKKSLKQPNTAIPCPLGDPQSCNLMVKNLPR